MMTLRTVSAALADAAGSGRGLHVVEHDGRSSWMSYEELRADSLRIAGALGDRRLVAGDRVALVVPEVGRFIRAFFGISAAGLVPMPLCPPAQAGDIDTFARQSRHVITAGRANALVSTPQVEALLETTTPAFCVDELRAGRALADHVETPPGAAALLQFTSGSTAAPKGVVLTHANLHANISAIVGPEGLNVQPGDVGVSWLPLYHDMGLIGMLLSAMYTGNTLVAMSPLLFLKRPTAWLDAISSHHGTVSFAPPFAYELCVRRVKASHIASLDLSGWRVAGCGAEPIRPDVLRSFAEHFAPAGFRPSSFVASYGLAEHTLAVTFSHGEPAIDRVDADGLRHESIGTPTCSEPSVRFVGCGGAFPGHEVRIVGADGAPLGERQVGSIMARGPSVMSGYFENPSATQEAICDGWLDTGDLGYVAAGQLYVCGRTKDLIIRQGRKYHAADLESAIAESPGLRLSGAVVFALASAGQPEEVVAVVEVRASQATEAAELVRRRVGEAAGLNIDHVVAVPPGTIPRTTSGKVKRAETRDRYQTGTLTAAPADL